MSGIRDTGPSGRPARRRVTRLAAVLFFDGFRAAPGWMAAVTASCSCWAAWPPPATRWATDCWSTGRWRVVGAHAWGVVVVGGLLSLGWVLTAIGATEAMALSDRIATSASTS